MPLRLSQNAASASDNAIPPQSAQRQPAAIQDSLDREDRWNERQHELEVLRESQGHQYRMQRDRLLTVFAVASIAAFSYVMASFLAHQAPSFLPGVLTTILVTAVGTAANWLFQRNSG